MKFENIRVYNFENALRGMRNPKNSWHLSDSKFGLGRLDDVVEKGLEVGKYHAESRTEKGEYPYNSIDEGYIGANCVTYSDNGYFEYAIIGPNDMKLALALIRGGSEHRKFLRQISVTVDITAPLFWWKEFDTYRVGVTANSTSTMHKMLSKEITLDSFDIDDFYNIPYSLEAQREDLKYPIDPDFIQMCLIPYLEYLRKKSLALSNAAKQETDPDKAAMLEEEAKVVWKELIRWLPEGWLQTRTVTMNYENLLAMCSKSQRRFHKLTEWSGVDEKVVTPTFIKFARSLPYAKYFIFFDEMFDN